MKLPRHAQLWLPGYLFGEWRSVRRPANGEGRLWVVVCDHFEPFGASRGDMQAAGEIVAYWRRQWPETSRRHADDNGRPAAYTFFYPAEEYRAELLAPLAEIAHAGLGDVEVHLHHDNDTAAGFLATMNGFLGALEKTHGLLRRDAGQLRFGFIHGNWALDNARPDGRWCGLNDEITLLKRLGCYADFTLPCGTLEAQTRTLNVVYWAVDDPARPRSHEYGTVVRPGHGAAGDLLLIPGPLGIRWTERWRPRMEMGELAGYDPVTPKRVRRWLGLAPVIGRDVFLKIHTHGAQVRNSQYLLGGGLENLFRLVRAECTRKQWELRFSTAWEVYQAVLRAGRGN